MLWILKSALAKTTLILSKDETVSYSSAKSEEEEGKKKVRL